MMEYGTSSTTGLGVRTQVGYPVHPVPTGPFLQNATKQSAFWRAVEYASFPVSQPFGTVNLAPRSAESVDANERDQLSRLPLPS